MTVFNASTTIKIMQPQNTLFFQSHLLSCTAAGLIMSAAYAVPYLILGVPLLGSFHSGAAGFIGILLCVTAVIHLLQILSSEN